MSLFRAIVRPSNYSGVLKTLILCRSPIEFLRRYSLNSGTYPSQVALRTPIGTLQVGVYSPDDLQTINEIYFRGDYDCGNDAQVIVDFGSNIGISVGYFLSRNHQAYCYGYEPLPQNIERFHTNAATFSARVELTEAAVGEGDGIVQFGWEPTGRYGGIERQTGQMIEVPCRDSNSELRRILDRHAEIDILKVDIETMEKTVVGRIPPEIAQRIKRLVVEYPFDENPLASTHRMTVDTSITHFVRL
jgi:FkbM family methyltransferase